MNSIYIPSHHTDGSSLLLLGLIMRAINNNLFDRVIIVGEVDFYSEYFDGELESNLLFLSDNDSEMSTSIQTIKSLDEHGVQNNETYFFVFISPLIKISDFELHHCLLVRDYRCEQFEVLKDKSWSVLLPPGFKRTNEIIQNISKLLDGNLAKDSIAHQLSLIIKE